MGNSLSITDIKNRLEQAAAVAFQASGTEGAKRLEQLIESYREDDRGGVRKLLEKYDKLLRKDREELLRIEKMRSFEKYYQETTGISLICGIDEVGRGPLAGPVVAGAVILPPDCRIRYVNDSKKLSEARREELYDIIMEKAVATGIGMVGPDVIDDINILQATYEAMRRAIKKLHVQPGILLNDAVTIPDIEIPQIPIIKGDALSISIAAASIIAKVTRDRMMVEYDGMFPGYGFASNKGYGSKAHMEAIKKLGPTAIHRRTFIKGIIV